MKKIGGKQGVVYYGQCENGENNVNNYITDN